MLTARASERDRIMGSSSAPTTTSRTVQRSRADRARRRRSAPLRGAAPQTPALYEDGDLSIDGHRFAFT